MGTMRTVAATLLLAGLGLAATFEIRWPEAWGDRPRDIWQLADGGCIVCGTGYRPHQEAFTKLIRTDSLGDTIWTRELIGNTDGRACLTGGGFITAVGSHYDTGYWYLDTHRVGLNNDTVGLTSLQLGIAGVNSIAPTADGGAVFGTRMTRGTVTKLDAFGQVQWSTQVGSTYTAESRSVHQARNGGYLMVGSHEDSIGRWQFFAAGLDSAGRELWFRIGVEDSLGISGGAVLQMPDGRVVAAGVGLDTVMNTLVAATVTFDSGGSVSDHRIYPNGDSLDVFIHDVALTHDGGLLMCGGHTYMWSLTRQRLYLLRIDAQGDTLWTREWRPLGCTTATGVAIEQTDDRGFIILASLDGAMGLVKTDSLGLVYSGVGELPTAGACKRVLTAKPNPFRRSVALSGLNGAVEIRDVAGRLVRSLAASRTSVWDGRDEFGRACASGVYTASARGTGTAVRLVLRR